MADTAGDDHPAVTVFAPAKINLYLHLTGRRADGFHTIDSLVAFAGVGDTVRVALADTLGLVIDGPRAEEVPQGEDNLVLAAARLLAAETGATIRLTKRLPTAAGIGGGSADGAAALKALGALWNLPLPADGGVVLGADLPVCLAGQASYVGGIGEALEPASVPPDVWLVLANPGIALPTPAVFAAREGQFSAPARFPRPPTDATGLADLLRQRRNDLTSPAQRLAPVVGEVLAALDGLGGALLSRMSGSGATCFALFAAPESAASAAESLAAAHPRWWVRAAPLLVQAPSPQAEP